MNPISQDLTKVVNHPGFADLSFDDGCPRKWAAGIRLREGQSVEWIFGETLIDVLAKSAARIDDANREPDHSSICDGELYHDLGWRTFMWQCRKCGRWCMPPETRVKPPAAPAP